MAKFEQFARDLNAPSANACLQTTVGNVNCGVRHGHCVCESRDVKIFLILALCDSIAAATFLSDPHPSDTSGSKPRDLVSIQSPPILGLWSH